MTENPAIVATAEAPLAELARQINAAHEECEHALRAGMQHARQAGQLLLEVKARVGHGKWLPWLKANVGFSARTAQRYMLVAERWDELVVKCDTVSHLTYREGLRLLASPTAAKARGKERPASTRSPPQPEPVTAAPAVQVADVWTQLYLFAMLGERKRRPRPTPLARAKRAAGRLSRADCAELQRWLDAGRPAGP
jgi:hypothetical protein